MMVNVMLILEKTKNRLLKMNCGENVRVKLVETRVGAEEEVDEGGDAHGGGG